MTVLDTGNSLDGIILEIETAVARLLHRDKNFCLDVVTRRYSSK